MVKVKEIRNSRINPTAVTDEFKEELTNICKVLRVREPDLVRSAVENYVKALYRDGEVITFEDESEMLNNGTSYVAGNYYQDGQVVYEFTLVVMYDSNSQSTSYDVAFLDKTPANEEDVRKQIIRKYEMLD